MEKQTQLKSKLFLTSFTAMLVADYFLEDIAEVFNLYFFLLSITGFSEKQFMIFQKQLDFWAYPTALLITIIFHYIIAVFLYKLIYNLNHRSKNEDN